MTACIQAHVVGLERNPQFDNIDENDIEHQSAFPNAASAFVEDILYTVYLTSLQYFSIIGQCELYTRQVAIL